MDTGGLISQLANIFSIVIPLLGGLLWLVKKLRGWTQQEARKLEERAAFYETLLDNLSDTRWNVASTGLHETLERLRHLERTADSTAAYSLIIGLLLLGMMILISGTRPFLSLALGALSLLYILLSIALGWLGEHRITRRRERIEQVLTTAIDRRLDALKAAR